MKKIILKESQVKRLLELLSSKDEMKATSDKSPQNVHKLLLMPLTPQK